MYSSIESLLGSGAPVVSKSGLFDSNLGATPDTSHPSNPGTTGMGWPRGVVLGKGVRARNEGPTSCSGQGVGPSAGGAGTRSGSGLRRGPRGRELGRASARDGWVRYVSTSVVAGTLQ